MATLVLNDLVKTFDDGDIVAVDKLSLEIDDSEFLVVVGPSGCGKSTTLNMIAGLETPADGTINLNGRDITNSPPQERDLAMVFQNYALYPHMSVESNIRFGLKMAGGIGEKELSRRTKETAELLQIEDLLDQRPAELSGGQRQRVALGRAIIQEPSLFLMDEPLSNLDAKLRSDMRTEIQRLQNTLGITTVYVTHDQTEAMTMGDRIAILNDGRLQQIASPEEVYHKPANRFVAGFIGEPSMNFYNVSRADTNSELLQFEQTDFSYEMSSIPESQEQLSEQLVLGIRPNHIRLAEKMTPDVKVEVQVVEPMGEYNLVHVALGEREWTVKLPGNSRPQESSQVGLEIPEEHIYLFNRNNGKAIRHPSAVELPA